MPRIRILFVLAICALLATMITDCAGFRNGGADGRHSQRVVIFATGNLQGALLPVDPGRGGAALLEAYYKAVRRELGDRLVWLDGGNLRGRSLAYGFDQGASFEKFVAASGIAASLGNSPAPPERISRGKILLASDIAAREPDSPSHELDADHPSAIVIPAGRLKLGVVSAPTATELVLEANSARAQGAQLVVWLTGLSVRCNPTGLIEHLIRKPGEPNGFCEGPVSDIVSSLPDGTINAVIASGGTEPLGHFIYPRYSADPQAGVPVVQDSPFGRDFHLIDLVFDPGTGKAVFSATRIEGPFPTIPITIAKNEFIGRPISPDADVQALSGPARAWVASQEKIVLASSSVELSGQDPRGPQGESGLTDLVADALRQETGSDFAIVPPGMTKHAFGNTALPAGTLSPIELARALPYDTPVTVIAVTGQELKTLVRISENGSRGFSSVSGMELRLIRPDRDAPVSDLDGDHRISLWERNRLLEITDLQDQPIFPRRVYHLAVPAYLVQGGDDWEWASRHFALAQRIKAAATYPSARELVAQYLVKLGSLQAVPSRTRFENPPGRHRRRHRRRFRVRARSRARSRRHQPRQHGGGS